MTAPLGTRVPPTPTRQAPGPTPPPSTGRVLLNELREELLGVVREPTTLFFTVAMPVGFFALFMGMWGTRTDGTTTVATMMLATFGAFGVVGVALLTPGIGVAEERERGWLRVKRVSATPLPVTIAAKVFACLPHALGVVGLMSLLALTIGRAEVDATNWWRVATVLVLGCLPFALVGLAVGFLASPNAATTILIALYLPSTVASGLWMPLEALPAVMSRIAPVLPTYHLGQLALAQLEGALGLAYVGALLGFAMLAATAAVLAYRHARS